MSFEHEYHNWDKDTSEDFWDIVDSVDAARIRDITAKRQARMVKSGKVKELELKIDAGLIIAELGDNIEDDDKFASTKLRKQYSYNRVKKLHKSGESVRRISMITGVHRNTVRKLIAEWKEEEICR